MSEKEVILRLKNLKGKIKVNTYRTIKGQIRSGNLAQALVGIERIERKLNND